MIDRTPVGAWDHICVARKKLAVCPRRHDMRCARRLMEPLFLAKGYCLEHRFRSLKAKQRAIREGFAETMGLRAHRAISWIGNAEVCGEDDDDARFISLWVAFNAAYADKQEFQAEALKERVFNPFRQYHYGIDGFEDWEDRFKASARSFAQSFQAGDSARAQSFVFDRIYVLRNQLVHGGSTGNSGVNRAQVRDGAEVLGFLMPVFIDIVMDNPDETGANHFIPSSNRLEGSQPITVFPSPHAAI